MTPREWRSLFTDAHPKAVDVPIQEYHTDRLMADEAASAKGYRLAGMRSGRAVFTTKPSAAAPRAPDA